MQKIRHLETLCLPIQLSALKEKLLAGKVVFFKKDSDDFFLDEGSFLGFLADGSKDDDHLVTWGELERYIKALSTTPASGESCPIDDSVFGIKSDNGDIIGWVHSNEFFRYKLAQEEKLRAELELIRGDLQTILDSSYDVIFVADGEGKTLRVSAACERLWGFREEELVGKSVYQLEKEGIFFPSATRLALEKREQIFTTQTTKEGRRLLVVATPRLDSKGEIIRVINASKDITEIAILQKELDKAKELSQKYFSELQEIKNKEPFDKDIIYSSKKIEDLLTVVQQIACVDSTVLLLGESGVGKEMFARTIYRESTRCKRLFVSVNCGAIPENLFESELFGYEKGAFTGANVKGKIGLAEQADGGILFLDEIGELSLPLQVKFLRFLQNQEVTRVGSLVPRRVDVRVIAATNADLVSKIKKGEFREDLYYRLNVVPLRIPALRERKEDITPLAHHFLQLFNQKYKRTKTFSPDAYKKLEEYDWPGNIRQLQNIIERMVVTQGDGEINGGHLANIFEPESPKSAVTVTKIIPLKEAAFELEKQLLTLALNKFKTTVAIAKALNVDQSTISRKLQTYEIDPKDQG